MRNADRLPPHSAEAEQGILGCILTDPGNTLDQCAQLVPNAEVMYDLRHRMLYELLNEMHSTGAHIDIITVQQLLKDRGQLDQVGGLAYLSVLPDTVPSAANLEYYTTIAVEKYQLRRLITACTEIVGRAYDGNETPQELVEIAEQQVMGIRIRECLKMKTVRDLVKDAIGEIEDAHQRQGVIKGISTGLAPLDNATGGLHPGETTVIAAFTSVGKTSLAMNIAANVCLIGKKSVGIFSLEMTSGSLVKRLLCCEARVNMRRVNAGQLEADDFPKLTRASVKIASGTIYFDDTSDLSIYQLRARARKMVKDYGIELFVIDYLQLMNAVGGPRRAQNREQEVADISNGVKNMAKEFRVPVIVLSQLNDDGQLRESRRIGQDADNLFKLNRDETEPNNEESEGVNLVIEKQRNGPRGITIPLTFLKKYTRFEARATVERRDVPRHKTPHNND